MLWCAVVGLIATVPLAIVPLASSEESLRGSSLWLVLYLVPQALAISLSVGLMVGVSVGLATPAAYSVQARRSVIAVGAWLAVLVGVLVCWLAPISNQVYLTSIGHPHARGLNELTSVELVRLLVSGTSLGGGLTRPVGLADISLALHSRAALTCAPILLALVSSTLACQRRWGRPAKALIACGVLMAYATLLPPIGMPASSSLPPVALAWSPNALLLVLWVVGRRLWITPENAADPLA
jgi:hypothetical protein